MPLRLALSLLLLLGALACSESEEQAELPRVPVGSSPATLAEWNLFADPAAQVPEADVLPFEVTSPLYTDGALKHRFFYVPEGKTIENADDETRWVFPEGSVLIKTFAFPVDERDPGLGEQLIETRLLVRETGGWRPFNYRWNDAQTEASFAPGGEYVSVSYIDAAGDTVMVDDYRVPSLGECRICHGPSTTTRTLGPSTAMLNRDNDFGEGDENQIDYYHAMGLLENPPASPGGRTTFVDPADEALMDDTEKARSYLHTNCAHCHAPDGEEAAKLLYLDYAHTDPVAGTPADWGACKEATSDDSDCGLSTDVVPGDPDSSLLLCRIEIVGKGQMPPLGRSTAHDLGSSIVAGWIADMLPTGCGAP